jgi:hypothetical protein
MREAALLGLFTRSSGRQQAAALVGEQPMGVIEWIDLGNVNEIVRAWPKVAREAAATMIEKYGSPNEACAGRLVWHNNGPWRHTVVYSEEVAHNFPTPHRDVLEQYIP